MKIKTTNERECCEFRDLKPVNIPGIRKIGHEPEFMFCQHCGRRHVYDSFMDAAGSRDYRYVPVKESWER